MSSVTKEKTITLLNKCCNIAYELTLKGNIYTLYITLGGLGDYLRASDCIEMQFNLSGTIIELNDKLISLYKQFPIIIDCGLINTMSTELQCSIVNSKSNETITLGNSNKISW